VNLEQPEDYDSEAVKAQALANAQSAFMKHEETVRSHSCYKRQRDGGDRLPDVTVDVDGIFLVQQQVYVGLARGSGPGGGGSTDLQDSCT